MASIAIWLAMANHNLSSNRYSWNDLDQVSFVILAIFSRNANIDRLSRPVESRKSVVRVRCCIRAVLYIAIFHACNFNVFFKGIVHRYCYDVNPFNLTACFIMKCDKCYDYAHQNGRSWTAVYNNVRGLWTFFLAYNVSIDQLVITVLYAVAQ